MDKSNVSDPDRPQWVCTLCMPIAIEIGHVLGRWIIYNMALQPYLDKLNASGWKDNWSKEYEDGRYAVLGGQGHGDSESGWFLQKPIVTDDYFDYCDYYEDHLTINEAHHHIEHITKVLDYSIENCGLYENYFVLKTSQLIERFERKYGNIEKLAEKRSLEIMKDLVQKKPS